MARRENSRREHGIGHGSDIPPLVDAILRKAGSGVPRERLKDVRAFMTDTMDRLWEAGNIDKHQTKRAHSKYHSVQELYRVLTEEPVGDDGHTSGLKALLHGKPSEDLLRPENAENFAAVRAIAGFALQSFKEGVTEDSTRNVGRQSAPLRKKAVKALYKGKSGTAKAPADSSNGPKNKRTRDDGQTLH